MMLSRYQDKYGLWHDKPCKNGEPSSNNWMIYTAYAYLLGLPVDMIKVKEYFLKCIVKVVNGEINITRHPGKKDPPLSLDEITGAVILGLIPVKVLAKNHYVFHGKGKKLNMEIIAKFLLKAGEMKLREAFGEKFDRNSFWKNNIVEIKDMAFRVNPGQLYFFKKKGKRTVTNQDKELVRWNIAATLDDGSPGQKNLLWAMAKMAGQKDLAKKCDAKKNFGRYFPKDHDFNKILK